MGFEGAFGLLLVSLLVIHGFIILAFTVGLIKTEKPGSLKVGNLVNSSTHQLRHFVSVIIPVRNETGNIFRILEEMRKQDIR